MQHNLTILVFKGSERVQNLVLLLLLPLWAPKVARERFNKRLESQEWLRCPLDYWIGMVWLGGHFNIVGFFFTGFMNLDSPIIRTGCNLCGVRVSESPWNQGYFPEDISVCRYPWTKLQVISWFSDSQSWTMEQVLTIPLEGFRKSFPKSAALPCGQFGTKGNQDPAALRKTFLSLLTA